jgi:hypothetical protein
LAFGTREFEGLSKSPPSSVVIIFFILTSGHYAYLGRLFTTNHCIK